MPYNIAGLLVTILGCSVAPRIAKLSRPGSSTFLVSAAATLGLLLLLSTVLDMGDLLGWWRGPRILLVGSLSYLSGNDVWVRLKIFLPASILSGAVA